MTDKFGKGWLPHFLGSRNFRSFTDICHEENVLLFMLYTLINSNQDFLSACQPDIDQNCLSVLAGKATWLALSLSP